MFNMRRPKTSPAATDPAAAASWHDDDPLEELGRLIDRDMRGAEAQAAGDQAWYAEPANDPHADHWYADAALRGTQEAHGYDPAHDSGAYGDEAYAEGAAPHGYDPATGNVDAGYAGHGYAEADGVYAEAAYDETVAYDETAYDEAAYHADASADPVHAAAAYAPAVAGVAARPAVDRSTLADPWDGDYPGSYDEQLSAYADPDADIDPQRVEHGVLPPHDEGEVAAAPGGGRRLGVVAAVLGVMVLGGIGAVAWGLSGGSGGGVAELVRAPEGPIKIIPDPAAPSDDGAGEGDVVFRAKAGTVGKSEERIVPREEIVPDLPGVDGVARVVMPDGSVREEEPIDVGPKKVRTVLVRPDGSIITAPDRTAALPAPTDNDSALFSGGDDFADDGQLMSSMPTLVDGAEAAAIEQTPAVATEPAPDVVAMATDPAPAVEPAPLAPAAVAEPAPVAPAAVPRPSDRPAVAATGPIELMPDPAAPPAAQPAAPQQTAALQPQPAAPAPAASGGPGFRVQLASLPSEAAAQSTASRLQQRFASVIGALPTEIQRADLGAKGVYYRVKVGPMPSRDEANRLCERLKSAGGDCIVSRD